jgi:glycerol-3-phosphate acyltransferase PlsX
MAELLHTMVVDVTGDLDGWSALRAAATASIELDVHIEVIGPPDLIWQALRHIAHDAERLQILDSLPDARSGRRFDPMLEGLRRTAELPDATFLTAGPPRSLLRAAAQTLAPLPTVKQPALAAVYPTLQRDAPGQDAFGLLLDIGATVKCSDGDLVRFATMGAVYARLLAADRRPRVGLLTGGTTADRWPKRLREAHAWLQQDDLPFAYLGPVAADQATLGQVDVLVTDGFTGDVMIRTLEGVATTAEHLLEDALQRLRFRVGMSLLGEGIQRLRRLADWENYGGAPLLGYHRNVITTHQRATERSVFNALRLARKIRRTGLLPQLELALGRLEANRPEAATRFREPGHG